MSIKSLKKRDYIVIPTINIDAFSNKMTNFAWAKYNLWQPQE